VEEGPFPASEHDITILQGGKSDEPKETWDQTSLNFATNELLSNDLREDVRGIGGSGYSGEPKVIFVSQEGESQELHEFLAQSENHEETLHSRFKSWNILESHFCPGDGTDKRMEFHGYVMTVITVMTQYNFEQIHHSRFVE
jgi:hypothetical protein